MTDDTHPFEVLRRSLEALAVADSAALARGVPDDVIRALLAVADAAGDLSTDYRQAHREMPWAVLTEMGTVIRRAGADLDPRTVANMLTDDVPELRSRVARLS